MKNPCAEIKLPIKIVVNKRKNRYNIWLGRIYQKNIHKNVGSFDQVKEEIAFFLKELGDDT